MELVNPIICLLVVMGLQWIAYQMGKKEGLKHADKILGIEYKKALRRIKDQADRNN